MLSLIIPCDWNSVIHVRCNNQISPEIPGYCTETWATLFLSYFGAATGYLRRYPITAPNTVTRHLHLYDISLSNKRIYLVIAPKCRQNNSLSENAKTCVSKKSGDTRFLHRTLQLCLSHSLHNI